MNVFITCSYIPPQSDIIIYKQHIEAINAVILKSKPADFIFVVGDFNLPQISWHYSTECGYYIPSSSNEIADDVFNNISDLCLHQINGVRNIFGKLLDLVFVNDPKECSVNRADPVTLPEDQYHPAIEISCNIPNVIRNKNSVRREKYFCFKRANYNDLNSLLVNTNWLELLTTPKSKPCFIDEMVDRFYNIMFEYMSECIPKFSLRTITGPPWNSKQLAALKNLKNKYFKKYKACGSHLFYRKYTVLRAEYNQLNMQMYNNYLNNMKSNLLRDPKSFFTFVNSKRKSSGIPNVMKYLNCESCVEKEISDMFADFFSTTFSAASYNNTDDYPYRINSNQMITTSSINTTHIVKCLKTFKSSIFSGPDGIPSCILINCASAIAAPLSIIFNTSLKYGYFPRKWKESFIIPFFKSGNKSNIINYRGIAKLSAIPKLFEKCTTDFLIHQVSPLLTPFQHGFRKGLSAMTNLLQFTTLVNKAFNNSYYTDVIYTDFSKAFDKVNHHLLLIKLDKMGFSSNYLSWINSYLLCRTQYVKFKSAVSKEILVTSGVPQGSHLGPILFLLFINDMPESIKYCNILMYADDVKIFLSLKNESDCMHLQSDLNNFNKWCAINLMELNLKKCKHMQFSRGQISVHSYILNNCELELVNTFLDLGILLDSKLNFLQHIMLTVNKARGVLAFIKRWAKEFNDPLITKCLYVSLVRPILEYGSIIWDPYYYVHINRIESVQKQFLIFCLRNVYRDFVNLPPYSVRLAEINLPTLKSRRTMLSVSFLFNLINGNVCCEFLLSNVSFIVPQRSLRSNTFLHVRTCRTNFAMADPLRRLCSCFNQMYNIIDLSSNINVVKRNIIAHLNN